MNQLHTNHVGVNIWHGGLNVMSKALGLTSVKCARSCVGLLSIPRLCHSTASLSTAGQRQRDNNTRFGNKQLGRALERNKLGRRDRSQHGVASTSPSYQGTFQAKSAGDNAFYKHTAGTKQTATTDTKLKEKHNTQPIWISVKHFQLSKPAADSTTALKITSFAEHDLGNTARNGVITRKKIWAFKTTHTVVMDISSFDYKDHQIWARQAQWS
ncbi:hypothetical protein NEUTE1DRAFT_99861 [Neurospora tetrasperma FGSC 2508]|uniref:Uncharacterized protein n=1 Tax=Neurospora tetrasperma (strain FGSC 2508 / ATCC MYA-4615 / P0657) TaxID=510951 RepID=F8MHZ3_NEUT8|nr:uncharacterized protein NEUTE1DRAFT_99861 [Neurospora tetrasperma FGSC 2508]EGO59701.1 hypothetical protein NEUTE1DRAFT_99861 [Neurospora tetrasperma FGSC 2508]